VEAPLRKPAAGAPLLIRAHQGQLLRCDRAGRPVGRVRDLRAPPPAPRL